MFRPVTSGQLSVRLTGSSRHQSGDTLTLVNTRERPLYVEHQGTHIHTGKQQGSHPHYGKHHGTNPYYGKQYLIVKNMMMFRKKI